MINSTSSPNSHHKTPHSLTLKNIGQVVTYNSSSSGVEFYYNTDMRIEGGLVAELGKNLNGPGEEIDCKGKLITPGFVDSHTHPVFMGGREKEYLMRLGGSTYEEIADKGGGIQSSIEGVRQASKEELIIKVLRRMDRFLQLGTTTVETKSGYGLDLESELKSLSVLDDVNRTHPINMVPTFLGAHAIPPEFSDSPEEYVSLLCEKIIPAVAKQGVAQYCDVFCEEGYFTVPQSKKILESGKSYGLTPRLHADEFIDSGAAELAARVHAISADHLMAVSDAGMDALASADVTATLLPGTTFFLGKTAYAPARKLMGKGIRVALATDFNPGSSHIQSMAFIMTLACMHLGMSAEEALTASTYHGAIALGLGHETGSLEPGKKADIILWDLDRLIEIPYTVSDHPIHLVIKEGQIVVRSEGYR